MALRNFLRIPYDIALLMKEQKRILKEQKRILKELEELREMRKKDRNAEYELRTELKGVRLNTGHLRLGQNLIRKWGWSINAKVNSLVRAQFLDLTDNLAARRFQLYSQHEEDGIALVLLKEAGATKRTFVEIGCGASGGNSGLLAEELGWSGLMVDANSNSLDIAQRFYSQNDKIKFVNAFVTPENINDIINKNGFENPDFFSLDIDSYDYWVFKELESRPKVLVLEYNSQFGQNPLTVPYLGIPEHAPKGYHGASLKALTKLADQKGYRLICCEQAGVNAFYLRNDLCPNIPGVHPDVAYRPKRTRKDPMGREEVEENITEEVKRLGLQLLEV